MPEVGERTHPTLAPCLRRAARAALCHRAYSAKEASRARTRAGASPSARLQTPARNAEAEGAPPHATTWSVAQRDEAEGGQSAL